MRNSNPAYGLGISMDVQNVFDLVGHFGKEEDQLSASFGFILRNNEDILEKFLKRIGIHEIPKKEWNNIDIETQVSRGIDKQSYIDLQLKLNGHFLIIVESKLQVTKFGEDQLEKYAEELKYEREKDSEHLVKIRLVCITQFDRRIEVEEKFTRLREIYQLHDDETQYMRWNEILEWVKDKNQNYPSPETKFINKLFIKYVGDRMTDTKKTDEQRVKDIEEVLIVSTNSDWLRLTEKEHKAIQDNSCQNAQFIAFYQTRPVGAITHIAKVKWTEKNILRNEVLQDYPKLREDQEKKGNKLCKVYHIEELVPLLHPIPSTRIGVRDRMYTTVPELLKAKTLEDLMQTSKKKDGGESLT